MGDYLITPAAEADLAALTVHLENAFGPMVAERKLALAFLADQPLREFALGTFNLNAFLYVP